MKENHTGLGEFLESLKALRRQQAPQNEEFDLEAEWEKLSGRVGFMPEKPARWAELNRPTMAQRHMRKIVAVLSSRSFRVAAVLLLFFLSSYVILQLVGVSIGSFPSESLATREVRTESGQRVNLRLSDGSIVMLNSCSVIRFPEQFASGSREIELEGEAFFDVSQRDDSPFTVRARHALVQVLGTRFDVKAWPDEPTVEVVVERGTVRVVPDSASGEGVVITDSQMTRLARGEQPSLPQPVDVAATTAWSNGTLLFLQTPFEQVIRQLERYYGFNIELADSTLAHRHLSASFTKIHSSNDVLKAISIALNVTFKQKGNTIIFAAQKNHHKTRPHNASKLP